MRILVVEDQGSDRRIHPNSPEFTRKGLQESSSSVEVCRNGNSAFALATSQEFDALVLDIMLMGKDGQSILRSLRGRSIATPVILLTARNEWNERVEGLNLGADDYLTKAVFVEELVARLQTLIRPSGGQAGKTVLQVGGLSFDIVKRMKRGDMASRSHDFRALRLRAGRSQLPVAGYGPAARRTSS